MGVIGVWKGKMRQLGRGYDGSMEMIFITM